MIFERYGVKRFVTQQLQEQAGKHAGMMAAFCERMGWRNLEMLIAAFQARPCLNLWYLSLGSRVTGLWKQSCAATNFKEDRQLGSSTYVPMALFFGMDRAQHCLKASVPEGTTGF